MKILTLLAMITLPWLPSLCAQDAPAEAPHVVFLVGDAEYRSEITMPAFAERLEDSFGFKTTVIHDEEITSSDENRMVGMEALDDADLVVIYTRFRRWPQANLEALEAYLASGRPIFGFRTSTHAFNYRQGDPRHRWNAFGAQVLGAPWIRHYGHGSSTKAQVVKREAAPELLAGVPDRFAVRSWTYHVKPNHPPIGTRVLMEGTPVFPNDREVKAEMVNPITWTMNTAAGGRVFMTTMGHPEDFHVAAFRRLIGNGVHWALGREIPKATLPDFPKVSHPDDMQDDEEEEGEKPWLAMDYGPFLSCVVGLPRKGAARPENVVHKGIVQRLRFPDGEESELMAVFDTDLLRWRCVWRGELALRGIVFDGPHGTFPEIDGEPLFIGAAQAGPIVGNAVPRDEPYGPVAPQVGRWSCLALAGEGLRFEYEACGGAMIRERLFALDEGFVREIECTGAEARLRFLDEALDDDWELVVDGASISAGGRILEIPENGSARIAFVPKESLSRDALGMLELPPLDEAVATRWGEPLVLEGIVDMQPESEKDAYALQLDAGKSVDLSLLAADPAPVELRPFDAKVAPPESALPVASGFLLRHLGSGSAKPARDSFLGRWPGDAGEGSHERNAVSGKKDLELQGVTWRRGIEGRSLDFDGTAVAWLREAKVNLEKSDLTVASWIQTTGDGSVFAIAPEKGKWASNGLTFFVRDGRLAVDVGWVGVLHSDVEVADGAWHHVALSWTRGGDKVRLFVDGRVVIEGSLPLRDEPPAAYVARFGWTNENFPATPHFSGYMDELVIVKRALTEDAVAALAGDALVEALVLRDAPAGSRFERKRDGSIHLIANASDTASTVAVERRRGYARSVLAWAGEGQGSGAIQRAPFRVDRLSWPDENPHDSWMRFGAFDFIASSEGNPTSAAIATWSGDVWRVDGLDEDLDELRWTRMATGLHQPFGVLAEDDGILVLGRDQITRLEDSNNDGEADRYRVHSNTPRNSQHFHEPASGLMRDEEGRLIWVKAARHAKFGLHDHHGSILRLDENGQDYEVLARGLRAPVGLTRLPDGSLLTTDQEGHWMPANRINILRPSATNPPFLGNGWSSGGSKERQERSGEQVYKGWTQAVERTTPPLCWLHPSYDRSPATLEHIDHPAWGPLAGSIFGLSYGTGELYLVLRDDVKRPDGSVVSQGGAVKLGVQLPTGILDARVHPETGDLYCCGLFGWSSNRTEPGGFFRIRPNAETLATLDVPVRVRAFEDGLEMSFIGQIPSLDAKDWTIEAWNYKQSSRYGSPDYSLEGKKGERSRFAVRSLRRLDEHTVFVELEGFRPAMQVEVSWGSERRAHLSVHALRKR